MNTEYSETLSSTSAARASQKKNHGRRAAAKPAAEPASAPAIEAVVAVPLDDADNDEGVNVMLDAGVRAMVVEFDADMHDIASGHLRHVCPETQLSINYVAATTNLIGLYDDLDWTLLQFRELDEQQFSLHFTMAHRAATAMSATNPNRAVLLAEFDAKEKQWATRRHRLQTRERHLQTRIANMKNVLHQMELEQLNEWELAKAQVRSYEEGVYV